MACDDFSVSSVDGHFRLTIQEKRASGGFLISMAFRCENLVTNAVSQAYREVFRELALLPDCLEVTRLFCTCTSGIFIIDGKYVKVRGYKQKIPFIYCIDYETHDILFGVLAPSEDERTMNLLAASCTLAEPRRGIKAQGSAHHHLKQFQLVFV